MTLITPSTALLPILVVALLAPQVLPLVLNKSKWEISIRVNFRPVRFTLTMNALGLIGFGFVW